MPSELDSIRCPPHPDFVVTADPPAVLSLAASIVRTSRFYRLAESRKTSEL